MYSFYVTEKYASSKGAPVESAVEMRKRQAEKEKQRKLAEVGYHGYHGGFLTLLTRRF